MSTGVALDVQVSRALEHLGEALGSRGNSQPDRLRLLKATSSWFDEQNTYFPRGPLRLAVEVLVADIALALQDQCIADALLVLTATSGNDIDRLLSEQARLALDEVWPDGAPELLARISVMCAAFGLDAAARSAPRS